MLGTQPTKVSRLEQITSELSKMGQKRPAQEGSFDEMEVKRPFALQESVTAQLLDSIIIKSEIMDSEPASHSDTETDETGYESKASDGRHSTDNHPATDEDFVDDGGNVCHITGRLSLVNNIIKYPFTVEELQRRIDYPEKMNVSLLNGIMRKGKSKNGALKLREQCRRLGYSVEHGQRKQAELTVFSSLCEGEANNMATDFAKLTSHIPVKEMALECERRSSENSESAEDQENLDVRRKRKREQLVAAKSVLTGFMSVLDDFEKEKALPPAVSEGIHKFSCFTHSFGLPTLGSCMNVFKKFIDASLEEDEPERKLLPKVPNSAPPPSNAPIKPEAKAILSELLVNNKHMTIGELLDMVQQ